MTRVVSEKAPFSLAGGLPAADVQYLETLARETWDCIASLVHPGTGLPFDKNDFSIKHTSVSNIGIYAAVLAGAVEMGFLSLKEAEARAVRLMDGVEKLRSWRGFCQSWNEIDTLAPSPHDTWISILDTGNMAAGLTALKHAFPALSARVGKYVDAMEWSAFYEPETGTLCGGYNMATSSFNREWKLTLLGSDSRLASLFAIGTGQADPRHWGTLTRDLETRHGHSYLTPGWQGGGLFMQYISGLFIDDRGTLMGRSAAAFACAQMAHARATSSPVWGWSASDSPGGKYLGWQALVDNVVTPHASSLPLSHFPAPCVANLRKLEELGARRPSSVNGKDRRFGFRDAIDLSTKEVTSSYLILDQGMLFLSIVNALKDGAIIRWVAQDPAVRKGRELISEYRPENIDLAAFWDEVRAMPGKPS